MLLMFQHRRIVPSSTMLFLSKNFSPNFFSCKPPLFFCKKLRNCKAERRNKNFCFYCTEYIQRFLFLCTTSMK